MLHLLAQNTPMPLRQMQTNRGFMNDCASNTKFPLILRDIDGEPIEIHEWHLELLTPSERATFLRLLDKILTNPYGYGCFNTLRSQK